MAKPDSSTIAPRLIAWHAEHGRHDLPWQTPATPYRVWVSEVMLQQTQVGTVIPYFTRFMERYPDVVDLSQASLDGVLALWAGLGYYSRARNLHRTAFMVVAHHDGGLPTNLEGLMALPGIGRSTAGAILALAHNLPCPILDGNAKRVLARFHAIGGDPSKAAVSKRLWAAAEASLPRQHAKTYTQALMDLGSSVCTRTRPACPSCPLRADCRANAEGTPEAYPQSRSRPTRPHRETIMLILRDAHNRVLLERRPPSGIWGGLWSLPEFESLDSLDDLVSARFGVTMASSQHRKALQHGFTHYTLTILPVSARINDDASLSMDDDSLRWCTVTQLGSTGLPRPVATLLQQEFT